MAQKSQSKKFLKLLKSCDMFGKPVQLLIKKEEGHKTLFGAALTLTLLVLFGILLYNDLISLFNHKNPKYLQTEVFHSNPDAYKLTSNNFTITFALQDPQFQTYIDESIYVVEPSIIQKTTVIENEKAEDKYESFPFPLTKCTPELIRQTELYNYFTHIELDSNFCIDWDKIQELQLDGTFDAPHYTYLMFSFKMCNENTKKGKECQSRDKIIEALSRNYISLQLSSYTIDLTNFDNSFQAKGEDMFTTISGKLYKEIIIYMQPITTNSDVGYIQSDTKIEKTIRYKRQTEMIDLNDGDTFLNLVFRLDTIELVNYRSYPKLQDIFGYLGGLWEVLFTIILVLQTPISNLSYQLSLVNSLFNFENNNQQQELKSKDIDIDCIQDDQNPIQSKRTLNSPYNQSDLLFNQNKPIQTMRNTNRSVVSDKANKRLQSIMIKQQQLEGLTSDIELNDKQKESITKAISKSIKHYFRIVSKKLKLTCCEYIYFLKIFTPETEIKAKQIQFSIDKLRKQIDIIYIIKKLQEIDKLKMILLTQPQVQLFDYLPKPSISSDPYSTSNQQFQYFSILKTSKNYHQQAEEAHQAFLEILKNPNELINSNLIKSMDDDLMELIKFKFQKEEQSQNHNSQIDEQIESIRPYVLEDNNFFSQS